MAGELATASFFVEANQLALWATGLLTALLPCGWLYLFALFAAGTGSWLSGSVVMIAFWLGSVPALVAVVMSTKLLTGRLRQFVPVAVALDDDCGWWLYDGWSWFRELALIGRDSSSETTCIRRKCFRILR